ncbi:hypothetical protein [uncultured Bacteroides sp.]|uniref:hypothetical protein n=1 Tax=uncultured Bacteroides sp. TaxID=162156 RepID=UPI00261F1697|nr:hypothetical protein [uncultured Bacteroides sp.]
MVDFLFYVLLVFGILQIILFFKIWGMTNDIKAIKDCLIKATTIHDKQDCKNEKKVSLDGFTANGGKFETGTIVLYTPENLKVKILGFDGSDVYKCETLDNNPKVYNFKSYVLKSIEE